MSQYIAGSFYCQAIQNKILMTLNLKSCHTHILTLQPQNVSDRCSSRTYSPTIMSEHERCYLNYNSNELIGRWCFDNSWRGQRKRGRRLSSHLPRLKVPSPSEASSVTTSGIPQRRLCREPLRGEYRRAPTLSGPLTHVLYSSFFGATSSSLVTFFFPATRAAAFATMPFSFSVLTGPFSVTLPSLVIILTLWA